MYVIGSRTYPVLSDHLGHLGHCFLYLLEPAGKTDDRDTSVQAHLEHRLGQKAQLTKMSKDTS